MGSDKLSLIISLVISLLFSSMTHGSEGYDPESLQALFHDLANITLPKHRTGVIYNLSLPSNFSGMQVSVVRIRTGTFRKRGANFSSINIPPKVITTPQTKRIALVYENLGNWSSYYYNVPNHSLVAPVVGFSVYDASNSTELNDEELTLTITGDPISISFLGIVQEDKNATFKCVKFGAESVEFSNMTGPNKCVTNGSGHFSLVVPSPPTKKEKRMQMWRVVGFVVGFGGLVLLILVVVAILKLVKTKKMRKMDSETEKGVALDSTWIGRSRMPSASMIRTQPALEHEYVP